MHSDIAELADGRHGRAGLEARWKALEMLLKEARETTANSYEMDWLNYRLRETESQLGEANAT